VGNNKMIEKTVISYMGAKDRAIGTLVSKRWRDLCHQAEEKEIEEWILVLDRKRARRVQERERRQEMDLEDHDPNSLHCLDWELTDKFHSFWLQYRSLQDDKRCIELLDKGAKPHSLFNAERYPSDDYMKYIDDSMIL
jgi:hypothetical protein